MFKTTNKITAFAIIVCVLTAFFYLYDVLLQVSPGVMAGELRHDFGLDATTLGSIIGIYFYSYTAMQIPAGLLLDRFGARHVICLAIFICASSTLLFAFAHNIYIIAIARFLMGGASAFSFLCKLYLVFRLLPTAYFAFFAGLAQMLSSIGAIGGTTPLAIFINYFGWRMAMGSFAIFGFALMICLWILLGRSKITSKPIHHKTKVKTRLKAILKNPQTWFIGIYAFAVWAPIVVFPELWGVSFLTEAYHLTKIQASNGIALIWVGIAISSPAVGWISSHMHLRNPLLIIVAALGLTGSLLMLFKLNMPLYSIYSALILIGVAAGGQSLSFGIIKDINRPHNTSVANGFNNMCVVLGGALFQPLVGKLLDLNWHGTMVHGIRHYSAHNFQIALILIPVCYVVAILINIFFIRETHCEPTHHGILKRNHG